jgi:hypothetical protein
LSLHPDPRLGRDRRDSYLSAAGRPGIVAWASLIFGVVWLAVTTPLLPFIGVIAIGIGNICGALVEVSVLDRATRFSAGVTPSRPLLKPLAVALVAGTVGWLVCVTGPPGFAIAIAAGALTIVLSFVGLWLTCRADLMDTVRLAGGTVRDSIPHLRKPSTEGA